MALQSGAIVAAAYAIRNDRDRELKDSMQIKVIAQLLLAFCSKKAASLSGCLALKRQFPIKMARF